MIIEFIQSNPKTSIIGIAVAVSLFVTIVNFFILDKDKMRELKAKQKELQEKIKLAGNDPVKKMEYSKDMMSHTLENMKHSMTPVIITLVPMILILNWIKDVFSATSIAGSWFWWYLGAAIASSMIFRKIFKLP